MGTVEQIQIEESTPTGIFEARPLSMTSASRASQLLQLNHKNYHIYIHTLSLHSILVSIVILGY
jgi:hypothetical protein